MNDSSAAKTTETGTVISFINYQSGIRSNRPVFELKWKQERNEAVRDEIDRSVRLFMDEKAKREREQAEQLKQHFQALFDEAEQLKNEKLKNEVLNTVESLLEAFDKSRKSNSPPALPLPPEDYEPYQPRTDAMEHLQKWFSNYLTYFGAKEDLIFQQDLRQLDEPLMVALDNQVRYKNRTGKMTDKVADLIKPLEEKINKQLSNIHLSDIKKSVSLYQSARKRSLIQ